MTDLTEDEERALQVLLAWEDRKTEHMAQLGSLIDLWLKRRGYKVGNSRGVSGDSLHAYLTTAGVIAYKRVTLFTVLHGRPDGYYLPFWNRERLVATLAYLELSPLTVLRELDIEGAPEDPVPGEYPAEVISLVDSFYYTEPESPHPTKPRRRIDLELVADFGRFVAKTYMGRKGCGGQAAFATYLGEAEDLLLLPKENKGRSSSSVSTVSRLLNGAGSTWTLRRLDILATFAETTPQAIVADYARWRGQQDNAIH